MEPNKCEGWKWYNWDNKSTLPSLLFYPVEQIVSKFIY